MVAGEVKRSEMMQNLFGDNSEEEEEEIDSEHESNPQPHYPSDEAEGGVEPGEEGEAEIEVHGEPEAESDGEQGVVEPGEGESEGEREESSQEGDVADPREESEEEEGDEERVATTRRRDVVESGSERSGERRYESEDEEVEQTRSPRSPSQEKEEAPVAQSDVNIRNVFGSSDDEDAEEYVRNDIEADEPRSPIEDEEGSEKDQRPDDMMLDDDMAPEEDPRYESEDERVEVRHRERPVGPPLEVEVPFRPPPGDPEKMNMIKVSSIMGIDPNPFDAKTFVEEDTFERDGEKTRIRLVNNIVRHRFVKGRDGKTYSESNARFVRWSDGSLQLLIGNEVLDITEQDARQDQNHLLLKHEKGILQSQGRILKKMRFIPSSLTSNSHRLLTALLDSREKKDFKVKNCVTDIDPEREKEKRERMESQNLKASTKLSQAREKIKRKYPLPVARRQLSTGYLEDALEEDEETDHYGSHRSNRGYEEDLEAEAQRERRIMSAKKSQKGFPGRSSMSSARPTRRQAEYSESEREESEYETEEEEEEEERPRSRKRVKEPEDEYEEHAEEDDEEEDGKANRYSEEDEEAEAEKDRGSGRKRKGIESDEEESPPRKAPTHRRMAMVYDSDED
ncbi:protein LEO1 homolog isoform X1 [Brassica rapa]|uniref:Leo1-like protein n=1 Tax=Brassica campestris TaxID=3711 RepID=M4F4E0_BRACM|nr:protein LEO1 homolog isoform X1 [Brassica rapa]